MSVDVAAVRERAAALVAFAEGLDQAGLTELARRARLAAGDVVELADEVESERSARLAMQTNYARCLNIIGRAAYDSVEAAVAEREGSS